MLAVQDSLEPESEVKALRAEGCWGEVRVLSASIEAQLQNVASCHEGKQMPLPPPLTCAHSAPPQAPAAAAVAKSVGQLGEHGVENGPFWRVSYTPFYTPSQTHLPSRRRSSWALDTPLSSHPIPCSPPPLPHPEFQTHLPSRRPSWWAPPCL